jgi:hypothetical protein
LEEPYDFQQQIPAERLIFSFFSTFLSIQAPAPAPKAAALGKVGATASGGKVLPKEEVSDDVKAFLKVRLNVLRYLLFDLLIYTLFPLLILRPSLS